MMVLTAKTVHSALQIEGISFERNCGAGPTELVM